MPTFRHGFPPYRRRSRIHRLFFGQSNKPPEPGAGCGAAALPRVGRTPRPARLGGRTETPPQHSQRVLLAKQRTAPRRGGASREARRPSIAPYRNGTAPWGPRGGAWSRDTATGHGRCTRKEAHATGRGRWRGMPFAGVMAVGRDVPIASLFAFPWCGFVAVGRDAWPPGLPARAAAPRRGARLYIPRPRRRAIAHGGSPLRRKPSKIVAAFCSWV